jgi:hypothetical protein
LGGRSRRRWRDEVEEDLNMIRRKREMGRDRRVWRRIFIGNVGPQRTVTLEEEEEGEMMMK